MTSNLPEHVLNSIKLEGIFMPRARRQRDAVYNKHKRFVHYTSAENAVKIIRTKRLWMRSTTCMADYMEVEIGHDMLLRAFSDGARERFISALDLIAPGAAIEAVKHFDDWWEHIRLSCYISSISEHDSDEDLHGRLSMWRAFGGTLPKVALVIRVPEYSGGAEQLKLTFSPVAYLTGEDVKLTLSDIIDNITTETSFLRTLDRSVIVANTFNMLLGAVTCIKHKGFQEELEWRAIYTPKFAPSSLMISSTEVVGGVPQIIYQIPLDKEFSPDLAGLDLASIFDRLIIGPSPFPVAMYEAFVDVLTKAGVSDAQSRVWNSNIPLRN